jgi:hypothetical protein
VAFLEEKRLMTIRQMGITEILQRRLRLATHAGRA